MSNIIPQEVVDYFIESNILTKDEIKLLLEGSCFQLTKTTPNGVNKTFVKDQLYKHIYFASDDGMDTSHINRYNSKIPFEWLLKDGDKTSTRVNKATQRYKSYYYLSSTCPFIPCRHYFDLDGLQEPLTNENIKDLLIAFYDPIRLDVVRFSVTQSIKTIDNNNTYGYHIVVPALSSSPQDLCNFVKYQNNNQNLKYKFDERVYNGGRLFRLPYSTDRIKPNPHVITYGTFEDWDLANTEDTKFIKFSNYINFNNIIKPIIKREVQDYDDNAVSKSLFYDRLDSKWNFDLVPTVTKVKVFIEFVKHVLSMRNHTKESKYSEFWIHNMRTSHNDDSTCPDEYKNDLVISKYLIAKQLKFTIARSIFTEYGYSYNKRFTNQLINRYLKISCEEFDKCLTSKAKSTGLIYDIASKISLIEVYDDRRLYKMIYKYKQDLIKDFLFDRNIMSSRFNINQLHPFISSLYTFEDYIQNNPRYTTLTQHLYHLSQCVAYVLQNKSYVIKTMNESTQRISYEFHGLAYFQRELGINAKFVINFDVSNHDLIMNNVTIPDEVIDMMSDDVDKISVSSKDSTNTKEQKYKQVGYKEKNIGDLLRILRDNNLLMLFKYQTPFADITYDIDKDNNKIPIKREQIKRNTNKIQNSIFKEISKEMGYDLTTHDDYNSNDSRNNLPVLSNFNPPIELPKSNGGYNVELIKTWLQFMLKRIKPKYHNAFIDLLYSIRERLTTSKPTPTKCYILYGKYGCEGKSFLLACLSKVFGSASMDLDRNKFLNEKFDAWKKCLGLIAVEECEGNAYTQLQLATQIKNYTTKDTTIRDMNKINEKSVNYGVLCLSTNDETLNGLVNADSPTIDRLVVIRFKKLDFEKEEWDPIVEDSINHEAFAYSLWRYLISSCGFIANEGKSYNYTSERYNGQEKTLFIEKAKSKANNLSNIFVSLLKYKDEKYNQAATWVHELTKQDCYDWFKILEYSPHDNKTYINTKTLEVYIDEFNNKYTKTKITKKDVESSLIKNGWLHGSPIILYNRERVYGYYKNLDENDLLFKESVSHYLFNNDNHEESENEDSINEEQKLEVKKLFEDVIHDNKKYQYILVKDANKIIKNAGINKQIAMTILKELGFDETPCNTTINKKSVYVYRKR